ncbi:hypothetical protein ACOMHN_046556 [Nucella lapillus]
MPRLGSKRRSNQLANARTLKKLKKTNETSAPGEISVGIFTVSQMPMCKQMKSKTGHLLMYFSSLDYVIWCVQTVHKLDSQ